jgi:hypothetical protein
MGECFELFVSVEAGPGRGVGVESHHYTTTWRSTERGTETLAQVLRVDRKSTEADATGARLSALNAFSNGNRYATASVNAFSASGGVSHWVHVRRHRR